MRTFTLIVLDHVGRACTDAKYHQSLRCSITQHMEVDKISSYTYNKKMSAMTFIGCSAAMQLVPLFYPYPSLAQHISKYFQVYIDAGSI